MPVKKNLILAAAALIVLLLGYNAIFRWPALKQAEDKQQKLIAAIENRQWGRVQRLTSENYADSLELDRDQLILALKDVGFLTGSDFELNWEQLEMQRDGAAVVITGNLRLSGGLGPGASHVESYARRFAGEPFTFRWRKTGLLPWKWQLESLHHADAALPAGYRPGEIRENIRRGEF
jgi:hypothetical protein